MCVCVCVSVCCHIYTLIHFSGVAIGRVELGGGPKSIYSLSQWHSQSWAQAQSIRVQAQAVRGSKSAGPGSKAKSDSIGLCVFIYCRV